MEFLCLAAGKGSRFGRLGSYLQKCMYPILGRPFLEHALESLVRGTGESGIGGRVTFIVGHYAEQIRSYFGNSFEGLALEYVEQDEPLGTGHAVSLAHRAQNYTEPVTIWLADSFHRAERFRDVRDSPHVHTLTVAQHPFDRDRNERVDVDGDRIVRAWQGTGPYVDIGLWRFGPDLLGRMSGSRADEFRALLNVQAAIDDGAEVGAVFSPEWIHLGAAEPSFEASIREVTQYFLEEPDRA